MEPKEVTNKQRKIIHIDMDCFYAAIEIRDNPSLKDRPVAVGGSADRRGVLCTCNYLAREYGVRAAMPTAKALRLCPDLIVLPVNMKKYQQISEQLHKIFHQYTHFVEPLSLDEAYLDVTDCELYQGSATWIAEAIRAEIRQQTGLTASAGVAPNKFLAKIASAWKKPDGLFVISPPRVMAFVNHLEVNKLFGVGKVTAAKLHDRNIRTCADLQEIPLRLLIQDFGKLGEHLYHQCRGIDNRPVQPNRLRKSLSVETTLTEDIRDSNQALAIIDKLNDELIRRINESAAKFAIKNLYIKIKFDDFQLVSAETKGSQVDLQQFHDLFNKLYREQKAIRLLGVGVHFQVNEKVQTFIQQTLF
ncbi:DNA polymerase IV [Legionella massiliensis]|uniref:DNA polymerase IV n=1 Tax=Legionella massiliensis TaxID=1034943 RepID=A0A078KYB9_9GAMM|nr:DNA polymerase IV [Legionella massiliensis]CDZ78052.1 DNA polymerase IV [Legionella massiliensis]CEE13790.1 DNA polymerase IV [Legionella massiliensis]